MRLVDTSIPATTPFPFPPSVPLSSTMCGVQTGWRARPSCGISDRLGTPAGTANRRRSTMPHPRAAFLQFPTVQAGKGGPLTRLTLDVIVAKSRVGLAICPNPFDLDWRGSGEPRTLILLAMIKVRSLYPHDGAGKDCQFHPKGFNRKDSAGKGCLPPTPYGLPLRLVN
jgi:hypothetical protein